MTAETNGFYDFTQGKMTITLTTACNLSCVMCPVIIADKPGTLPRDKAFEAAEFAVAQGFPKIELSGGEPFLMPYIHDLIETLCSGGAKQVFITTNATLLTPEHIRRMARFENIHVQVSFDGTREAHNAIRRDPQAFEKADAAIRLMAELGISISINSVIQKGNLGGLMDLYRHFADLPYKWHAMNPYEPHSPNMDQVALPPESAPALARELTAILTLAQEQGKPVVLTENLIEEFANRVAGKDAKGQKAHPGLLCTVPRRAIFVTAIGVVISCVHYAWSKNPIPRSLHEQSIADIVFSKPFQDSVRTATGPGGCAGCSTMCYTFDPDFNRKVLHPALADNLLFELARQLEETRNPA